MILLGEKVWFYKTKLLKLISIYINFFFKQLGGHCPPKSKLISVSDSHVSEFWKWNFLEDIVLLKAMVKKSNSFLPLI